MHISMALTLLALIGGTFLLAKVKKDAMSSFYKWVAYLVITMSFIILLFDLTHAVMGMMHCRDRAGMSEHGCGPEMCGGMQGCMPGQGHMGGKMHGDMKCCDEEMEHGEGAGCHDMEEHDAEHGLEKDSSKK